jgi:hypothetical protein
MSPRCGLGRHEAGFYKYVAPTALSAGASSKFTILRSEGMEGKKFEVGESRKGSFASR